MRHSNELNFYVSFFSNIFLKGCGELISKNERNSEFALRMGEQEGSRHYLRAKTVAIPCLRMATATLVLYGLGCHHQIEAKHDSIAIDKQLVLRKNTRTHPYSGEISIAFVSFSSRAACDIRATTWLSFISLLIAIPILGFGSLLQQLWFWLTLLNVK